MKNIIVNNYMNYIKQNKNYSKEKLEKIEYGLTGLYLTISKMIIIFILAFVLGIFKEMLIFMILFNIFRSTAFGLHATKSWICLISSIVAFIGLPLVAMTIKINIIAKIIICLICIVLFLLFSPADTKKRPIVNKKRRILFKTITTINSILVSLLCVFINNNFISNSIIFSMILEIVLILPISYSIFNLPYNNYKDYLKNHPELSQ